MTLFGNPAFMDPASSSFTELLSRLDLLPKLGRSADEPPHGTTIVALGFSEGVLMAGDRRAVAGGWIAARDIEKVFAADDTSVIGVAGTAGLAQELVKLFQMELEHYEKIDGGRLSLVGRANRLAAVLRMNLELAFNDLAVIPLYAGFESGRGRIFSYDVVGGRYEEHDFAAVGSGAVFARGSLKKTFDRHASFEAALASAVEALLDASDEDSATGGADAGREIWPVVYSASAAGVSRVSDEQLKAVVAAAEVRRSERWSK